MEDALTYKNVNSYKHLHVGDTVHIIRHESCAYKCPICHGKGKFKAMVTTSDGIEIKGKMKCKYCIGIGAIAVDRYIPVTVTINVIEVWSDGDIIVRTDNLYHVGVNETLYSSHEDAQNACDARNRNIYIKSGNYHMSNDDVCIPNDSYVDFGKLGLFYINTEGIVSRIKKFSEV